MMAFPSAKASQLDDFWPRHRVQDHPVGLEDAENPVMEGEEELIVPVVEQRTSLPPMSQCGSAASGDWSPAPG